MEEGRLRLLRMREKAGGEQGADEGVFMEGVREHKGDTPPKKVYICWEGRAVQEESNAVCDGVRVCGVGVLDNDIVWRDKALSLHFSQNFSDVKGLTL